MIELTYRFSTPIGARLPMAHSMGWTVPALGIEDFKLMEEPFQLSESGPEEVVGLSIQLAGYEALLD